METYTITPQDGTYTVEATSEDGTYREVGTFRSEQVAVAYLKRLQQKAEPPRPGAGPGSAASHLGSRGAPSEPPA
jgi:hypothetical protein